MELPSYNCALCQENVEELVSHLFIECQFASDCWETLDLHPHANLQPLQNPELLRAQIDKSFYLEIIILMCWTIWKCRNNQIFSNVAEVQVYVQE